MKKIEKGQEHTNALQAGLRAVHDLGPEIRRAISGNLDEEDFADKDVEEPMHRRNHKLFGFGSVMTALAGVHKTAIPFASRTQSLLINQTPKISSHTNLSPQNSLNGKVTPAESCNHLSVEQRNAINRTPSPLAPVRVSPMMSNDSRRQSHTSGISSSESHQNMLPPRSPSSPQRSESESPQWDKYKPPELIKKQGIYVYRDLPQEDSDYERDEHAPPTPPPRKLSRRGASLRLACIGKQQSDENPLMKKIAEPLKLAQTQAMAVAGLTSDGRQRPNDYPTTGLPVNRASYQNRGHNMSPRQNLHRGSDGMAMDDSQGMYSRTNEAGPLIIPNYVLANQKYRQSSHTKSSAESLVEKVLTEEGLDRYVDAHTLQQEIAEANDMTTDDLDKAARMLLHAPDENHSSSSHPGQRSPYYEHLGGFLVQEMKDYNCYSTKDDLNHKGYSQASSELSDDEMVFVTSL